MIKMYKLKLSFKKKVGSFLAAIMSFGFMSTEYTYAVLPPSWKDLTEFEQNDVRSIANICNVPLSFSFEDVVFMKLKDALTDKSYFCFAFLDTKRKSGFFSGDLYLPANLSNAVARLKNLDAYTIQVNVECDGRRNIYTCSGYKNFFSVFDRENKLIGHLCGGSRVESQSYGMDVNKLFNYNPFDLESQPVEYKKIRDLTRSFDELYIDLTGKCYPVAAVWASEDDIRRGTIDQA